jgi:hypothetical protein
LTSVNVRDTRFDKVYSSRKVLTYLFVYALFCSLLLFACGAPASPSKSLMSQEMENNGTHGIGTVTPLTQVLPVKVVNEKTNVSAYPAGQMNLTISTSPFAVCSFVVDYGRGKPSSNVGVVPRTADANGMASWTWRVDSDAHIGAWPLTITALLPNGSKTSTQINVSVTLPPINVLGSQTNLRALPGGIMQLTIATAPGVDCTVSFSFGPTGRSRSISQFTNYTGVASLTWRIDPKTLAGVWPVAITVTLADGEKVSNQISVTVL